MSPETTSEARTVKKTEPERLGETAYKYAKTAIGNRLTNTLNEYIAKAPEEHGEYLRNGFLRLSPIRQFLAGNPKKGATYHIDKVKMPDSYKKFQEVIALFLNGLSHTDPLYNAFYSVFEETNFAIQRTTDDIYDYHVIYVGLSRQKSRSQHSLLETGWSMFRHVFTSTEQKQKNNVIKYINKAYQKRLTLINQTILLRRIVDIHEKYVTWWKRPTIEPTDFEALARQAPKEEDSPEVLEALHAEILKSNSQIQTEFIVLFNSLPTQFDTVPHRELMTLPEETSLTQSLKDMDSVLKLPTGWRDAIRKRWVLCRQGYVDERNKKAALIEEVAALTGLLTDIKHSLLWENVEKADWAQNLMVEWLWQNTPAPLCQVGRIKCSSGLRKAWKGKLETWEISWKPRITGAQAPEVTPSCFRRLSTR